MLTRIFIEKHNELILDIPFMEKRREAIKNICKKMPVTVKSPANKSEWFNINIFDGFCHQIKDLLNNNRKVQLQ